MILGEILGKKLGKRQVKRYLVKGLLEVNIYNQFACNFSILNCNDLKTVLQYDSFIWPQGVFLRLGFQHELFCQVYVKH